MQKFQYILPHRILSMMVGRLLRSQIKWWKNLQIRIFSRFYQIEWNDLASSSLTAYPHFNAFFTRALKPGARPLANAALIAPADGRLTTHGQLHNGKLIQAKGHDYTVRELLAGNAQESEQFASGSFFTIYLAPHNYHRVHMAMDGRLLCERQVPGRLFSVNQRTASIIPRLFVRNERLVCIFAHQRGVWAQVLVGALLVGSIQSVWRAHAYGHPRTLFEQDYADDPHAPELRKGEEMGRFLMGSTVIVLTSWRFSCADALACSEIRMGHALGYYD